jgi:hypothetical protein
MRRPLAPAVIHEGRLREEAEELKRSAAARHAFTREAPLRQRGRPKSRPLLPWPHVMEAHQVNLLALPVPGHLEQVHHAQKP